MSWSAWFLVFSGLFWGAQLLEDPDIFSICTSSSPCGLHEGDCDEDVDCKGSLICGADNCKDFHSTADASYDCCINRGCRGDIDQMGCCTSSSPCGLHGGDCDEDVDCEGSLVCGVDNCKDFHPTAEAGYDCCINRGCRGDSDQRSCCTISSPCGLHGGDCDGDVHCEGSLICGSNNCQDFHPTADATTDCCVNKECRGDSDQWSCCTSSVPCGLYGGDCNEDIDCMGSLICGKNNCQFYHSTADATSDCCIYQDSCTDCCGLLKLTTADSQAVIHQGERLGWYMRTGDCFNGFPVYKQISGIHYLFWMVESWNEYWTVDSTVGMNSGGIFIDSQHSCPKDITGWIYWNGAQFIEDATFKAYCSNVMYPSQVSEGIDEKAFKDGSGDDKNISVSFDAFP